MFHIQVIKIKSSSGPILSGLKLTSYFLLQPQSYRHITVECIKIRTLTLTTLMFNMCLIVTSWFMYLTWQIMNVSITFTWTHRYFFTTSQSIMSHLWQYCNRNVCCPSNKTPLTIERDDTNYVFSIEKKLQLL